MNGYKFPVSDKEAPLHAVYPFITGAYRKGGTYWDNVKSLFHLHTEFVNAWSMIIASFGSVCATLYASMFVIDKAAIHVFALFTASAVLHLPFTVGYHLFMSMDVHTFNVWRRLDVIGIFNVSVLLTYSLGYFVLPWWACLTNSFVSCIVAYKATRAFWKTPLDHVIDGTRQSKFVGCIIICYLFPMMCASVKDGLFSVSSMCTVGVVSSLLFSGWSYASWWPQKHWPGRFNVWFHSHQMMHLGVVVCHALEFVFIYENWKKK